MIKSQADQRRPQHMKDQHGRPWFANVEKASGFPTGLVQPQFRVPDKRLIPPSKYLVFSTENPGQVQIDYPQWEADVKAQLAEWDANRLRMGLARYGDAFNARGETPIELMTLLGPRPMAVDPIVAMRQGNPWALGFSDVKPPEAQRFFPDPIRTPEAPVFSDTPVFSDPTTAAPAAAESPDGTVHLAELMARLDRECPETLKGMARSNWIMGQLRSAAQPVAQGV